MTVMVDRTGKSRVGGAALAAALILAAALALVWATSGIAHADDPPSATFHVTSTVAMGYTTEDGEPITITKVAMVVNIDFGDILLPAGIDPSAITVTVGGVPLDFTKHAFTFNNQRLSVTMEQWRREGTVSEADLQQIRNSDVSVSYVPPADTGDERLSYASGGDVETFEVTARGLTLGTTEEKDAVNFVAPAEPKTVTATIRGNASPTKSQTVTLEPGTARNSGTSAPTGQNLTDLVRRICQQLGSNCH